MAHLSDEQLSRLIDGELSLDARETARAHLRACTTCAARHDGLIELATALRLQAPVRWDRDAAQALFDRVEPRRERPRAALLAAAVCIIALLLGAAQPSVVHAAGSVARATLHLLAALMPSGSTTTGGTLLGVLLGFALISPLAAYPLLRWR